MFEHIIMHLTTQVTDYVEVRNPSTKTKILQLVAKYEKRHGYREKSRIRSIMSDDRIGIREDGYPTSVEMETGVMQVWYRGKRMRGSRMCFRLVLNILEMQEIGISRK
ncbi:hypothetical protein TNCV_250661 [Trichonephila clavipes]|nr:hypothetical protein TNCV_250661 [Trichonephila clavipes]